MNTVLMEESKRQSEKIEMLSEKLLVNNKSSSKSIDSTNTKDSQIINNSLYATNYNENSDINCGSNDIFMDMCNQNKFNRYNQDPY